MSSRAPRARPGCGARGDGPGREAQGSTGRQGLRDVDTPRGHPEAPSEQRPPARHEQRAAEPTRRPQRWPGLGQRGAGAGGPPPTPHHGVEAVAAEPHGPCFSHVAHRMHGGRLRREPPPPRAPRRAASSARAPRRARPASPASPAPAPPAAGHVSGADEGRPSPLPPPGAPSPLPPARGPCGAAAAGGLRAVAGVPRSERAQGRRRTAPARARAGEEAAGQRARPSAKSPLLMALNTRRAGGPAPPQNLAAGPPGPPAARPRL